MPERPHQIQDLLAHADWLRGLATRLVGESDGEDVVQETWMAAVRATPVDQGGRARQWLAHVLRNFVRKRWRAEIARKEREHAEAMLSTSAATAEELLERAQTQRALADLVLSLDEPFRQVVLLRYYEGKSAAEIARTLQVPAGTIRWRLREALERLRLRLDDRYDGDRRRWKALVAPLVLPGAYLGKGLMMAMTTKGKLVMGGVLVALLLGLGLLFPVWLSDGLGSDPPKSLARRRAPPATHVILREGALGTGNIEGVVADPDGQPIAGALVTLVRAPLPGDVGRQRPAAIATSGPGGRFTFDQGWIGAYQVTAAAPKFRAAVSPVFGVEAGKRKRLRLTLGKGGATISGRVMDVGGGPIPGAIVTAALGYPWNINYGTPRPSRQFAAISDQHGRFEMTLEPREYSLRVEAGGYVPAESTAAVTRSVSRDFTLGPAARVEGRVLERGTGAPVANAEVTLSGGHFAFQATRVVFSDDQGQFVIDDAATGAFELSARHRGRGLFSQPRRVVALATQAHAGIELELGPGVQLTGRVRDQAGTGVGGITVVVQGTEIGVWERARTVSEADGAFVVALAGPGRYRLVAGGIAVSEPRGEAMVAVGPRGLEGAELVLTRGPDQHAFVGRVLAASGRPVAGALVRVEPPGPRRGEHLGTAESSEDGSFRIDSLPAGPAWIHAWHPREGIRELGVDPAVSSDHLELRLQVGATIGGLVMFDDGEPAAGISVSVTRQEGTVIYDSDTSGPDGRFSVRNLAPGRYTVQATRKSGPFNLWTSREEPFLRLVEVAEGEQKLDVDLVLKRGGHTITGTAYLADGTPAIGAHVIANREKDGRSWKPSFHRLEHQATADEQGVWRLDDVENDTFSLWASLPDLPDARVMGVKAGQADVRLVFEPESKLSGSVVGIDGEPIPAFHLTAVPVKEPGETPAQRDRRMNLSREPPTRVQEPRGVFVIGGLLAGTYVVKVTKAEGGAGAQETVTIGRGEHRSGVRLTIGAGVAARGRVVTLEGGKPIANVSVRTTVAGRDIECKTAADGTFVLEGLVPGEEIQVEVNMPSFERVGELADVVVPKGVASFDIGVFRLMAGDWRARRRKAGSLGLLVRVREGQPTVIRLSPDSPAAAAGIQEGDRLLAVDGRDVAGLGPGAIHYLLSQPPGTEVKLDLVAASGERRSVVLVATAGK